MPLAPRWKLYDLIIQHIGKKRRRKKQREAFSYRHLYDPELVCPGVVYIYIHTCDMWGIAKIRVSVGQSAHDLFSKRSKAQIKAEKH